MRSSSLLTAAALVVSLAACTSAIGTDFSGIPSMNSTDPTAQKLAQFPADPPVQMNPSQMHPSQVRSGPYDSPDFVVPPYETEP